MAANEQAIKRLDGRINDRLVDIELAKKAIGLGVDNGVDYEQKIADYRAHIEQLKQQKAALAADKKDVR